MIVAILAALIGSLNAGISITGADSNNHTFQMDFDDPGSSDVGRISIIFRSTTHILGGTTNSIGAICVASDDQAELQDGQTYDAFATFAYCTQSEAA